MSRVSSISFLVLVLAVSGMHNVAAAACVWKVSAPNGDTLYLGGSVHALRGADYPLSAPYHRAFDASARLSLEVTPKDLQSSSQALGKAGEYAKGDSLKKHVDPRTYAYLRKFFGLLKVGEPQFSRYRPWFISLVLQDPSLHGLSSDLGVEGFLMKRARATNKPVEGLETSREHMNVFSGLTDKQSETLLLLTFIPQSEDNPHHLSLTDAWRRGDADGIAREMQQSYRDFPSFHDRILLARNRNWIPKIERYLQSGQIYFVVVGAAHMGGPDGVLALLRARGYRIEQL